MLESGLVAYLHAFHCYLLRYVFDPSYSIGILIHDPIALNDLIVVLIHVPIPHHLYVVHHDVGQPKKKYGKKMYGLRNEKKKYVGGTPHEYT